MDVSCTSTPPPVTQNHRDHANDSTPDIAASQDQSPREPSAPSIGGLVRDADFWFDDGNVVLAAGGTAFKIYKGLLLAQSSVFASSIAQATETFEGCPLVHTSDSPNDLRLLLHVLIPKTHRRVYIASQDANGYSCGELSVLGRLAHKYLIEDVKAQVLSCLTTHFTKSLDSWERAPPPFEMTRQHFAECIGVVALARLTNTQELLPMPLYFCTLLGGDIIQGWTRADGSVEHLGPADLRRCINAYGMLHREVAPLWTRAHSVTPPKGCSSSSVCLTIIRELRKKHLESKEAHWLLHNSPLSALPEGRRGLCAACTVRLDESSYKERNECLLALPFILDLEEDTV